MAPALRKKIIITAFILFHFGCVAAWVFPGTPWETGKGGDPKTTSTRWRIEPQAIIESYLGKTGQWQNWKLFAPNPMPYNRYLGGRVTYRSGDWKECTLPRVEQLDFAHAHLAARYREYQYGFVFLPAALEDLARFFARSLNDPANPPIRVSLYFCQRDIPPHNRPDLRAPNPPPVDYSRLLRDETLYERHPLLEYAVRPEDLR